MSQGEEVRRETEVRWYRRRPVLIAGISLLVVAVAVVGYLLTRTEQSSDGSSSTNKAAKTKQVRRAIDGVWDVAENEKLYPIAVMIENLSSIRPQGSLDQASLVYEALVEGGITRFLAVYTMTGPIDNIGPVRSARPYYLDWAKELKALYAHVGGSPQAMSDIQTKEIFDLDQFYNPTYFPRKNLDRAREHNVFTASKYLQFALRDKKAPAESDFTPWSFKDDAPIAERPITVDPIIIDFSSQSYRVVYQYDQASNTYRRFQADEPHMVMEKDVQISPKNVVVQYVKTGLADAQRLTMETVGSGQATLFRDGTVVEGIWEKQSSDDRTTYTDLDGQPFVFNAGPTWVEVVPTDHAVTY